MKRRYRIRGQLFCAVLLLSATLQAQPGGTVAQPEVMVAQPGVTVTALVDSVVRTGFYRIILPPRLVARCRAGLSDLRIYKPDGTTVPYVLRAAIDDPLNAGDLALPDPRIRRKDSSDKHSYYTLEYDDDYRIDRVSLVVSNPALYKREVRIMAAGDSAAGNLAGAVPVTSVSIDPHDTVFRLPGVKARTLMIDITNGDNPPLDITRVVSAQSGIYILTYFQAYGEYELEAGGSLAGPPDYDLHFFTDSLRQRPFDIGLQPVRVQGKPAAGVPDTATKVAVFPDKNGQMPARKSYLLLWGILVIVLLLLIYVSVKLAHAVSKKDQNDRL